MNNQQRVKDWMHKAGQSCPDKPTIPSLEIRKLRARLILEEAWETVEAMGLWIYDDSIGQSIEFKNVSVDVGNSEPDLVAISDGLADLQYVNLGTAVACGIDLEPVFSEVCRSNESKWWCKTEVDYLRKPEYSFRYVGDSLFCATDAGGKVIKSPSFSPPQLAPILKSQGAE